MSQISDASICPFSSKMSAQNEGMRPTDIKHFTYRTASNDQVSTNNLLTNW
jgi:hypothetical protein